MNGGTYLSLLALCENECDGKGTNNTVDGGLAHCECCISRRKSSNANPSRLVSKCFYEMTRVKERSNQSTITLTDFKDMQSFRENNKSRFTADGLNLCIENQKPHKYMK